MWEKIKGFKENFEKQKLDIKGNIECGIKNINNLIKINEIIQNSVVKNEYYDYDYMNYIKIISLFEEIDRIKENNKIEKEKNNENNLEKTITENISNLNLKEDYILIKHKKVTDIYFSNNIIENDCSGLSFNNSFDIYESEDKETNIAFLNKNKIVIFNLDKNIIEKEIEDSHKTNIFGFRTYFEKK